MVRESARRRVIARAARSRVLVHRVGRVHERERREQHPRRAHRAARRQPAPRVGLARDPVTGLGAPAPEPRCRVAGDELRVRVAEHARRRRPRNPVHPQLDEVHGRACFHAREPAGAIGPRPGGRHRGRHGGSVNVASVPLSTARQLRVRLRRRPPLRWSVSLRSPAWPRGRGAAGSGRATSAATSWRRP